MQLAGPMTIFCGMQLFNEGIQCFSLMIQRYGPWAEQNPRIAKVSLRDVSLMVCSPECQCASVMEPYAKQLGACQSWWPQPAFVCTHTTFTFS